MARSDVLVSVDWAEENLKTPGVVFVSGGGFPPVSSRMLIVVRSVSPPCVLCLSPRTTFAVNSTDSVTAARATTPTASTAATVTSVSVSNLDIAVLRTLLSRPIGRGNLGC